MTRLALVVAATAAMVLFLGIAFETLAFGETPKSPPKSPPVSPPKSPPVSPPKSPPVSPPITPGKIVVEKETIPVDPVPDFVFTGELSATLSDGETAEKQVAPGTYTVTESMIPAGWRLAGIGCNDIDSTGDVTAATATFVVASGETVVCTFTNEKLAKLTIKKETEARPGDATTFSIAGPGAITGAIADGGSLTDLLQGGQTYDVTETIPAGWNAVVDCDPASAVVNIPIETVVPPGPAPGFPDESVARTITVRVDLGVGADVECTFTNTQTGTIVITKFVKPGSQPADFGFAGSLGSFTLGVNTSIAPPLGTFLAPGSYLVGETVIPPGWGFEAATCEDSQAGGTPSTTSGTEASIELDPGETVTCVFENFLPAPPHQVGVFDPETARWDVILENRLPGSLLSFTYGDPGDMPVVGDWNCDGVETPGVVRNMGGSMWVYLSNSFGGVADIVFRLGDPGDQFLGGDFDGDGCDTVSLYRPSEARVYVFDRLGFGGRGLAVPDKAYFYGEIGDVAFVGDFDFDLTETFGVVRDVSPGRRHLFLRNSHGSGLADLVLAYGNPGDRNVFGDWDADGDWTPAAFRAVADQFGGQPGYFLKDTNRFGIADSDFPVALAEPNNRPVAGRFRPVLS